MSSPTLPFSSKQVNIWERGGKRNGGRWLVWACANTGGFSLESRVLILDVALSHALLVLQFKIGASALGCSTAIKLFMHVLFHISYTERTSPIIFVRFFFCIVISFCPYTLNFLPKFREAATSCIARHACRVVKRSPTKTTRQSGDIWSSHTLLVWEGIGKNSQFQSREQSALLRGHWLCAHQHELIHHSHFHNKPLCSSWNQTNQLPHGTTSCLQVLQAYELSNSFSMQQGTERKVGNLLSKKKKCWRDFKKIKNIMEHCSIRLAGKGLTVTSPIR